MILDFLRRLLSSLRPGAHPAGTSTRTSPQGVPPPTPTPVAAQAQSPLVLAYVGDAVYELYVRVHLVERAGMTRNFQPAATHLVRAATQSHILGVLEPRLTEAERDIVRRGRNADIGRIPKSASMIDYRRATALECLFGYLLLDDQEERLMELLQLAVDDGVPRSGESR